MMEHDMLDVAQKARFWLSNNIDPIGPQMFGHPKLRDIDEIPMLVVC